jgi:hypothetical protein
MSKTHDTIGDREFDAVTGGTKCTGGSAGGPVTLRSWRRYWGNWSKPRHRRSGSSWRGP